MQMNRDVDNYIRNLPDSSRKICLKLREVIAETGLQEDFKWRMPVYSRKSLVCGFGAFKQHVTFTFFQGALLSDSHNILAGETNQHNRSVKFTDASQINEQTEKILLEYLREAIKNDERGIRSKKRSIPIPPDLKKALLSRKLLDKFSKMPYTHRKEYIIWVKDTKKAEMRKSRIKKAVEKLSG